MLQSLLELPLGLLEILIHNDIILEPLEYQQTGHIQELGWGIDHCHFLCHQYIQQPLHITILDYTTVIRKWTTCVPLSPAQALPENSAALMPTGNMISPVAASIVIGFTTMEWATGFVGFEKVH